MKTNRCFFDVIFHNNITLYHDFVSFVDHKPASEFEHQSSDGFPNVSIMVDLHLRMTVVEYHCFVYVTSMNKLVLRYFIESMLLFIANLQKCLC